jgi:MerR family transcriptional regulator, light-induced transcriptional regulator
MMTPENELREPQYPMRVVVRRTGLKPSLLRAWERRYEAVVPGRSEGGQRLYSEADVRKLSLLKELVDAGHKISQIAPLGPSELFALIQRDEGISSEGPPGAGLRTNGQARTESGEALARAYLEEASRAVRGMHRSGLEQLLRRAATQLTPYEVVAGVVLPLLHRIGTEWEAGEVPAATEHVASAVIRRFLEGLLAVAELGGGGPLAIVGTPAGQRHEFGALLAGIITALEGWEVLWIGPDLPAEEIAGVARARNARLVAISALLPDPGDENGDLLHEVLELRRSLPEGTALMVGGHALERHAARLQAEGVHFGHDLEALRRLLASDGVPAG